MLRWAKSLILDSLDSGVPSGDVRAMQGNCKISEIGIILNRLTSQVGESYYGQGYGYGYGYGYGSQDEEEQPDAYPSSDVDEDQDPIRLDDEGSSASRRPWGMRGAA